MYENDEGDKIQPSSACTEHMPYRALEGFKVRLGEIY